MSLDVMVNNWRNALRQAVGMDKIYPVKIVRDELAKQYPLIGIKKEGDVGYDLPSTKRIVIPAASPRSVHNYVMMVAEATNAELIGDEMGRQYWMNKALEFLPRAVVDTGIKLQMPNNIWATIEARSSSSSKLLITPDSVIDAGYRGPLFAVVFNLGYDDYIVEEGERLVQVIFHERVLARMKEVDKLNDSARGESGFGSTGSK